MSSNNQSESIKKSQLEELVRSIIQTAVNEIQTIKDGYSHIKVPNNLPGGSDSDDSIVRAVAASAFGGTSQDWDILKDNKTEYGRVYFVYHERDKNVTSQFVWKTPDGVWKALVNKKWVEIQPHVDPSEMSCTSAAGPVSTPMAFSKRKIKEGGRIQDPTKEEMIDYLQTIYAQLLDRKTFDDAAEVAIYWFATQYHGGQTSNLYSVLSTSTFNPGPMAREPHMDSIERDMYEYLAHEFGGEQLAEMTTTGDVSGYNVPSAFSKKGGSIRGVAGSAALGYTLTVAGKKEMEKSGDKILENKQPLRRQRCAKCQQLKPTDANGYIEGWECYDCRKLEQIPTSEMKTKPEYGDQLRLAYKSAQNAKNAEAMAYYQLLMARPTSANVPFETFKGSWAYDQWIKRPAIQDKIKEIEAELKRFSWRS